MYKPLLPHKPAFPWSEGLLFRKEGGAENLKRIQLERDRHQWVSKEDLELYPASARTGIPGLPVPSVVSQSASVNSAGALEGLVSDVLAGCGLLFMVQLDALRLQHVLWSMHFRCLVFRQ